MNNEEVTPYVIASGDEGLQLNSGRRLGFAGAGYALPYFSEAVAVLSRDLGAKPVLASAQEDDWLAVKLESKNQTFYDETLAETAKGLGLVYAGQFDFGDPKDLEAGVRGHLVRPPKIHVAEQIVITVGGGEVNYSLQQFVISADWAHALTPEQTKALLQVQIDFYSEIVGKKLPLIINEEGVLSQEIKAANRSQVDAVLV